MDRSLSSFTSLRCCYWLALSTVRAYSDIATSFTHLTRHVSSGGKNYPLESHNGLNFTTRIKIYHGWRQKILRRGDLNRRLPALLLCRRINPSQKLEDISPFFLFPFPFSILSFPFRPFPSPSLIPSLPPFPITLFFSHSLSFSLLYSSPPFLHCLKSQLPLIQLGLGERCKLPQRRPAVPSTAQPNIWCIWGYRMLLVRAVFSAHLRKNTDKLEVVCCLVHK